MASSGKKTQIQKFRETARALECNEIFRGEGSSARLSYNLSERAEARLSRYRHSTRDKPYSHCSFELLSAFAGFEKVERQSLPDFLTTLVVREDGFEERFPDISKKRQSRIAR
jgi:hypothetical protein